MMLPSIITILYFLYGGLVVPEIYISFDPIIFLCPAFLSFFAAVFSRQIYRITGLLIAVINFVVVFLAIQFNFIVKITFG